MPRISNTPPYEYDSLAKDQIRTLELLPGEVETPLRARLRHVHLTQFRTERHPKAKEPIAWGKPVSSVDFEDAVCPYGHRRCECYEAILYAWGSSATVRDLIIDNTHGLPITKSLHQALQRFRLPDKSRVLWADRVCIDQSNTAEKSAQVALMGDVYESASRVVVWLGESEGQDYLAHALMSAGRSTFKGLPGSRTYFNSFVGAPWQKQLEYLPDAVMRRGKIVMKLEEKCVCCERPRMSSPELVSALALRAMHSLLARSWFRRLWVVQESALTSEVLIQSGTHTTPFDS